MNLLDSETVSSIFQTHCSAGFSKLQFSEAQHIMREVLAQQFLPAATQVYTLVVFISQRTHFLVSS